MRSMRRKTWPAWSGLLALSQLAIAAGCSEDFSPYNRLESLRVLAIQSEPVSPAPGETTTLTSLVYAPPDAGDVSYEWRWCPLAGDPAAGYPCLIDEAQLAMLGDFDIEIPDLDLGSEPTASFAHSLDPELLRELCDGVPGVPLLIDCTDGFPILIQLRVRAGDEELVAVQSLRLRLDAGGSSNRNPSVQGLTAIVGGEGHSLTNDGSAVLPRGRYTPIFADVPQPASEYYFGLDSDGEEAELRERLTLTWYVETGTTRSMRTSFIEGALHLYQAAENRWRPARTLSYARDESRLIVVIRDNRGGVSWREALVSLEASP